MNSYKKIDFHIHTKYSPDSDSRLQDIHRVSRSKGIIPTITDHNTLKALKHTPKPFIPGEEIKTELGDVIGLYINEVIPKRLSVDETFDRIRNQDGLVYLPHMFDLIRRGVGLKGDKNTLKKADIIEILNGRSNDAFDGRAKIFAKANKLLNGAGSDAHNLSEIGNCYMEFKKEINIGKIQNDPKYLLKLLKNSKPICKKRSSLLERLRTKWIKLKKKI